MTRLSALRDWSPPGNGPSIECIEAHAAGEPLRVIVGGWPTLAGATMLDRRRECRELHDHLRTALMWEPRGHADMYGCLITEPVRAGSDFGVLFLHNEGYSTMCGHGIIAVVTVALECGLIDTESETHPVAVDSPAGVIRAKAHLVAGRVERVSFMNVPSYVDRRAAVVTVPGLGTVTYDLAWGGAFYAYVDAGALGMSLDAAHVGDLIDVGMRIKRTVAKTTPPVHPEADDLSFLYGTIFVGPPEDARNHSRNVCVFADGAVDRSPTGTGVSGRAAIHVAKGDLDLNETIRIESIIGSTFDVAARERVRHPGFHGIVPEVTGRAHVTGRTQWVIDPSDPLSSGFRVR